MAHMIDETTGQAAFTYLQGTGKAWHGLGQETPKNSPLDVWAQNGGVSWNAYKSQLFFRSPKGHFKNVEGRVAIVRDDTNAALGTLSDIHYKIHQPIEILNFFKKFIDANDMELETVGGLKGGRIIFVNARMSDKFRIDIGGKDEIAPYFTLSTSFDGTLATSGLPTSIRVVCWNTFSAALSDAMRKSLVFRQKHGSVFDASRLQTALTATGEEIKVRAQVFNDLADKAMPAEQINEYFIKDVLDINPEDLSKFDKDGKPLVSTKSRNVIQLLQNSYTNGPGANTAKGTAWGAFNAVTHYLDHAARTRDTEGDGTNLSRLASSQFGPGALVKSKALAALMARTGVKVAA